MNTSNQQPPKPACQLYKNLFENRDREQTLELISKGLYAILENADRLVKDVLLLVGAKRYASAAFLIANADEEMAKSYIILDACRLEFSRHQSLLRRLCQAFYSHYAKHAYNEVVRWPRLHDMDHVKEVWEADIIRWYPSSSDPESVEPDFPHDTVFEREMPLYVDLIEYDQEWHTPQDNTWKFLFETRLGNGLLSKSKKAIARLRTTSELGLFNANCLSILNEVFRDQIINHKTTTNELYRIYREVAERFEKERDIPQKKFYSSALAEWPLYYFVGTKF